ncbi:MAG: division/cell wall cluster transcriptional repressor MraZ [Lachnospiraceae bacterium]|nr:division/cell wall cluster transcriptional repressor MraZ [Lachnospiraceae bacterium]MBQ8261396.1 division/cell wall cluster transcriptional repressor MraZ [Lachnospiraceae bacterium]
MFKGEYSHTIDTKGRIIVPVKLREALGDSFVVTKGLDGCLWMFDNAAWESVEKEIQAMPFTLKEARILARFMIAGASDGELDKQGRILVPPNLREYAQLDKEVVLSGVGSRVEIWSKERYNAITDYEDMDMIAEKLIDLGFRL